MGLLADIFGAGTVLTVERTDEGVDMSMAVGTPMRAPGSGTVRIYGNWYAGQPIVELAMDAPIDGQSYIYYAEQVTPHVGDGARVNAGDWVVRFAASGTGLEIGWGAPGGLTLAQATTGYHEGQQTDAGKAFAAALGVPVLATGQSQTVVVGGQGTGGGPALPAASVSLDPITSAITGASMYLAIRPGADNAAGRAHGGYLASKLTWDSFGGLHTFDKKGGH